jgi:t-SNARE complex subunit (syntaxin)
MEQEHDIDRIHTHTVTTLDNLETANQFIRQAIENQANRWVDQQNIFRFFDIIFVVFRVQIS